MCQTCSWPRRIVLLSAPVVLLVALVAHMCAQVLLPIAICTFRIVPRGRKRECFESHHAMTITAEHRVRFFYCTIRTVVAVGTVLFCVIRVHTARFEAKTHFMRQNCEDSLQARRKNEIVMHEVVTLPRHHVTAG
jgi:hypothetical protein